MTVTCQLIWHTKSGKSRRCRQPATVEIEGLKRLGAGRCRHRHRLCERHLRLVQQEQKVTVTARGIFAKRCQLT